MLDRYATAVIRPAVARLAQAARRAGLGANAITYAGFVLGMLSAALIAWDHPSVGLVVMALSRLCDAMDGAVARLTEATDAGGFFTPAFRWRSQFRIPRPTRWQRLFYWRPLSPPAPVFWHLPPSLPNAACAIWTIPTSRSTFWVASPRPPKHSRFFPLCASGPGTLPRLPLFLPHCVR